MLLGLAGAAFCAVMAWAASEPTPPRAPLAGQEHCTWEPGFDQHHLHPSHDDAASCRRYAESRGHEWLGEGSGFAVPPSRTCACGEVVQRWRFNPAPGGLESGCEGYVYSCSRPGGDCRWLDVGGVTVAGLETSSACRDHAEISGDAYLGFGAQQTASKPPSGACTCGERATRWYTEKRSAWPGIICAGYRYRCLAPVPDEPRPGAGGPAL